MIDSPIFIVGCSRSGTSLLRDLLRSHPRITFPTESHFIPKLYKAYGNPQNDREACKLARIILNLFWVRAWGLSLNPESFSHYRSYQEIVSRIYQEYALKENKPRWGDKTPEYITEIPIILEIFPSCRIIHIYRDGRDVALSWLRYPYGTENIFTAATAWKALVSTGRRVGKNLSPETYLEVKYENLISRPKETMEDICTFLGETFSDQILNPNTLKGGLPPALFGQRKASSASETKVVSTNQSKWKVEMSVSDRILFESISGDLSKTLGYETEGLTRRVSPLEQFMWKIHHLFWFSLSWLNTGRKKIWIPSHLLMRWATIRYYLKSAGLFSRFLRR